MRAALLAPRWPASWRAPSGPPSCARALSAHTLEAIALAGALGAAPAARRAAPARRRASGSTGCATCAWRSPARTCSPRASRRAPRSARRLAAALARKLDGELADGREAELRAALEARVMSPGGDRGGRRLELPGRGRALFTERAARQHVERRRRRRRARPTARASACASGSGVERLVRGYQVHGTVVRRVTAMPGAARSGARRRAGRRGAAPGRRPGHRAAGRRRDGARRRLPAGRARLRRARSPWSTPAGAAWPRGCSRRGCVRCASSAAAERSSRSSVPARESAATRSGRRCTPRSAAPTARGRHIDLRAIAHERLLGRRCGPTYATWTRARSATSASSPTGAKARAPAARRGSHG